MRIGQKGEKMKDLIERRDVLNLFDSVSQYMGNWLIQYIEDGISSITSAQPERKHGYWVESQEHVYMGNSVKEWTNWYCSECDAPNDKPSDFCPSCGADMRGEQDG